MNIVFFGSSNFALASLKALVLAGYDIAGVITQPDRLKGRGLHLGFTAVKDAARQAGLRVYQPKDVNSAGSLRALEELNPDIFVVVAYGQILSQDLLNIPSVFAINLHASLLPLYRGAAPVNRSLINGDKETGVTVIKMIKRMDAGPVILQEKIPVSENDTHASLEEKLSQKGAELLLKAVALIAANKYKLVPQQEGKATFAPKLRKEDGLIDWNKPAQEIVDLIRGCWGWPGAYTYYKGKLVKIYNGAARPPGRQATGPAGQIIGVSKEGIDVSAGGQSLLIKELQIEGKRVMSAQDFISGHKLSAGDKFTQNK